MKERWELLEKDLRSYGLGVILAGGYLLFVGVILKWIICPMAFVTGLPCPACGITRAMLLFLQGDFIGAWQMHPFFYILLVWAILAAVLRYILLKDITWMKYVAAVVAVAAIIFYIYRMVTLFPNQAPMIYYR